MKLNLGCGSTKLEDFINIDVEESCKPDLVHDFIKHPLPYNNGSVKEIVMFHTIEHISKRHHPYILKECHRLLIPGGRLIISYPEFLKCVENWKTNHKGMRQFWEATIYGRQLYPSDYHVALMDSDEFKQVLREQGFDRIYTYPEPRETFNSATFAIKGEAPINCEELVRDGMVNFHTKVIK